MTVYTDFIFYPKLQSGSIVIQLLKSHSEVVRDAYDQSDSMDDGMNADASLSALQYSLVNFVVHKQSHQFGYSLFPGAKPLGQVRPRLRLHSTVDLPQGWAWLPHRMNEGKYRYHFLSPLANCEMY